MWLSILIIYLCLWRLPKNATSSCDIHSKNDALLNFGSCFNSSFLIWSVPKNFINSKALEHIFLLDNFLCFVLSNLLEIFLCYTDEFVDDDDDEDDDELDDLDELEDVELEDDE